MEDEWIPTTMTVVWTQQDLANLKPMVRHGKPFYFYAGFCPDCGLPQYAAYHNPEGMVSPQAVLCGDCHSTYMGVLCKDELEAQRLCAEAERRMGLPASQHARISDLADKPGDQAGRKGP
jgi:ribosomal protein S27AE